MKNAFLALVAFGGIFMSTLANPIGAAQGLTTRQDDQDFTTQGQALETLFSKVQEQTALINKTADATADAPTDAQQDAAVASVIPQLQALTTLLSTAADGFSKRSLEGHDGFHKADIFILVSKLIFEVLFTVKKLLFKIGLGKLIIYLTPLTLALVKLIKSLDHVVAGLLIAVKDIANELLKAVGLGLLGLL